MYIEHKCSDLYASTGHTGCYRCKKNQKMRPNSIDQLILQCTATPYLRYHIHHYPSLYRTYSYTNIPYQWLWSLVIEQSLLICVDHQLPYMVTKLFPHFLLQLSGASTASTKSLYTMGIVQEGWILYQLSIDTNSIQLIFAFSGVKKSSYLKNCYT